MRRSESPPHIMACTSATRVCNSPAISEISVGSPSPPPPIQPVPTFFQPINIKRLRIARCPTEAPVTVQQQPVSSQNKHTQRKSSGSGGGGERIKSFSIADILGKREEVTNTNERLQSPTASTTVAAASSVKFDAAPAKLPLPIDSTIPIWDTLRAAPPLPLHTFLCPPTLLHNYEQQRLAWDYQRQLQEHFQAQAQLLRQMSMDPTIIPSEDGSERSRSSSTGSGDTCTPEVSVIDAEAEDASADEKDLNTVKNVQKKTAAGIGNASDTPLDALFQLSTKNFDEVQDPATLSIFATRPNPKKKRKSRTAFTNHQIFELEKRFLYQKYLSPADRDEIAAGLGLSNAQVITWFQNRRAKLKRDMEELKKDVETVKQLHDQSAGSSNISHKQQQQQTRRQQQQQRLAQSVILHSQQHQHQHQQPHMQLPLTAAGVSASRFHSSSNSSSNHNNADKQELRMLKMMTLMHYSSRAGGGVVGEAGARMAMHGVSLC